MKKKEDQGRIEELCCAIEDRIVESRNLVISAHRELLELDGVANPRGRVDPVALALDTTLVSIDRMQELATGYAHQLAEQVNGHG